jgi:hypothetical protein
MDKEWLDAALAQCANELQNMIKSEQAAIAKSAKEDAPAEESSGSEGPASPPPSDADGDDSSEASAPAEGPPSEASAPVDEASAPPPGAEASAPWTAHRTRARSRRSSRLRPSRLSRPST